MFLSLDVASLCVLQGKCMARRRMNYILNTIHSMFLVAATNGFVAGVVVCAVARWPVLYCKVHHRRFSLGLTNITFDLVQNQIIIFNVATITGVITKFIKAKSICG